MSNEHFYREDRPWGFFEVLTVSVGYKVKRFVVQPGMRLSLQRHNRRSEHWCIVSGDGLITRDGETVPCSPGHSFDIPVGALHRIENTGNVELGIVEVQFGDYVGEDDIERIDDDFGRHA